MPMLVWAPLSMQILVTLRGLNRFLKRLHGVGWGYEESEGRKWRVGLLKKSHIDKIPQNVLNVMSSYTENAVWNNVSECILMLSISIFPTHFWAANLCHMKSKLYWTWFGNVLFTPKCLNVSLCDLSLSIKSIAMLLSFFIKQCTLDVFTNDYIKVCCTNLNNLVP